MVVLGRTLLEVVDLLMADDSVVDVVDVALEVLERVLDLGRQRRGEREESEREESFEGRLHRGVQESE